MRALAAARLTIALAAGDRTKCHLQDGCISKGLEALVDDPQWRGILLWEDTAGNLSHDGHAQQVSVATDSPMSRSLPSITEHRRSSQSCQRPAKPEWARSPITCSNGFRCSHGHRHGYMRDPVKKSGPSQRQAARLATVPHRQPQERAVASPRVSDALWYTIQPLLCPGCRCR